MDRSELYRHATLATASQEQEQGEVDRYLASDERVPCPTPPSAETPETLKQPSKCASSEPTLTRRPSSHSMSTPSPNRVQAEKHLQQEANSKVESIDPKDIFFCFGREQGQFIFKSPKDLLYNVSTELANVLEEASIKRVFSASIGEGGATWLHFEESDGRKCQYRSLSLRKEYPALEKWLTTQIEKSNGPFTVSFGQGRKYAAASTTKSIFTTSRDIKTSVSLNELESCELVSLDRFGGYITIGQTAKGRSYYYNTLSRGWPSVFAKLTSTDAIVCAVLNPDNLTDFFVLTKSREAHYLVHESFETRLEAALHRCGITCFRYRLQSTNKTSTANDPVTVDKLDQAFRRFDEANKAKRRAEAIEVGLLTGVMVAACTVM